MEEEEVWRRRGSAACQKHKEFLVFSHPPDLGLWGSSVSAEMIVLQGFSTPPKPKEFNGVWALPGRRGLSGRAAGTRKPSPPLASETVLCGS